jgi:hypothetical protein
MMENLVRDEATVPAVKKQFGAYHEYLQAAATILLKGRGSPSRQLRAAVGHAVGFPTWRSLAVEQDLDDARAAELMGRLVANVRR